MRSALMTPNVPQFGASGAGVWSYYYDEKLWDQIYGAEGFTQITDGYFARHYPGQFPYSCSGYFLTDPSLWKYGRCSLALDQPNPLGWPTFTFGPFLAAYSYVAAGRGLGLWMIGYSTVQMAWWEQLGGEHYRYVRKKLAGLQLNIALNAAVNPFLTTAAYQNPAPS